MSDTSASRNKQIVDGLLAEAGLEGAGDLRPVLLELRGLAGGRPHPSAQVEALMAPAVKGNTPANSPAPASADASCAALAAAAPAYDSPGSAVHEPAVHEPAVGQQPSGQPSDGQPVDEPVDELAARRRSKRRLPLAAFSVAVALAAGGAAAAASDEGVRHTLGNVHHAVTFFVGTLTTGAGGHSADQPATGPAATPGVPSPTPTASVPAPAGGGAASRGQQGDGPSPVPAAPSSDAPGTPGISLPRQPVPGDLGTVPGTGKGPDGKPLPSPWVSPIPSGVAPTPPVELPLPVSPSPSPGH
jgi:hypothetical protein